MKNSLRILVVDDHQSLLLTYTLILRQQGHDVVGVTTYSEAVAHLGHKEFDLVLCDLGLQDEHSGLDVIDFAQQRHPRIESLLLTGFITPEVEQAAQQRGTALLCKPMHVPELLQRVEALAPPRKSISSAPAGMFRRQISP